MSIDFEFTDQNHYKAVLLFHGMTGSPYEMKKYGEFLYKNGYDTFCYSFPGHGDKINEINSVTYMDWCNFAQQKYNQLRNKYDEFYVSGLCLGATMAIYLAENNSDISGVIALSTTLFLDGTCMPWFKFLINLGCSTIIRYYYTFPEDSTLGIKNMNTRKALAKITSKTDIGMDNYPLSCINELLRLSKLVRNNLINVTCPILIIHSQYDNLAGPKGAQIVYDNVLSEIKEYIKLQNSYHMVLYDNEKMYVMDNALRFLKDLAQTKSQKELEVV